MNKFHSLTLALLIGAAAPIGAFAAGDPGSSRGDTAAAAASDMADAEVRKVDKENKKLTLKHGEIKSLDMPPMTMVFRVKDAVMFDKLQAGDKVKFKAENIGGALTVTVVEPAK
jgi:Cu/Ag efflux protein CusF